MAGKNPARTAALAGFIATRLRDLNLTANAASQAAGLERNAIRDIQRGSNPGTTKLTSLARVLLVRPEALLQLIDTPSDESSPRTPAALSSPTIVDDGDPLRFDAGPHDLPLVRQGAARMGEIIRDVPVARIARPAALAGRPLAYAVYAGDDLNAPMIRTGHIAYVDPSRPVQLDRPVRIFPRAGLPFLGILRQHDDHQVAVQVLSEAEPRLFPAAAVERLERVVAFSLLDD